MHAYFNSAVFRPTLVLVISVVAGWVLTVPGLMTPSSFVLLFGFVAAFAWVLRTTYMNAQPASSLAQSLHDADTDASVKRAPKRR
jgi:UPF0716 family protein affecting phage T7 exclusion